MVAIAWVPVFLLIKGDSGSFSRVLMCAAVILASPLAFAFYFAVWKHCETSDQCSSFLNHFIKLLDADTIRRISVSSDLVEFASQAMDMLRMIALGFGSLANSLVSMLIFDIPWLQYASQSVMETLRDQSIIGSWFYAFVAFMWWPLTTMQLSLILS